MSAPLDTADRAIERHRLDWQGEHVTVTYEANWLDMGLTAHLTVQAEREGPGVLPITDTGYRSHFTPVEAIDAAGGPVAFVLAWLDHAAKELAWQQLKDQQRQTSLL